MMCPKGGVGGGGSTKYINNNNKAPTVHLAVVGTKMSAPQISTMVVITGVEIYHTQFLRPINFVGRPGRIISGNT